MSPLIYQTLDGERSRVLGLAVWTASSADVNAFIALLEILNPTEKIQQHLYIYHNIHAGIKHKHTFIDDFTVSQLA